MIKKEIYGNWRVRSVYGRCEFFIIFIIVLWIVIDYILLLDSTKRYTPDTIRTVVAQEAHDYYSAHGFPLGYGSVPVRSRKRRRWRKIVGGSSTMTTAAGSDSDCASSSMTPSLSPTSPRDDEFMNEETYSFELMDDDDDMDGGGGGGGLRSMEDEWRYEGFEDGEEYDDEYDEDDEDEDYDDLYEDDEDDEDEEVDEVVVEGDGDGMSGNRKKKGDVSIVAGEDQDQDLDAEGEMEIDIEPFQDPSFNAELSTPTSPTTFSSSKVKSKSKLGEEPQSFVSSFYIPPVPQHVQHIMQMQQEQEEEVPAGLDSSSLDSSSCANSPVSSSSEGTPISTFDTVDHSTTTPSSPSDNNNENNHAPMQIHLPPAPPHHPHHYHSQLIQFSSNILPLPPPRLDSVRVFILRQSEMGGMKTTGRGTPADRKRGAIWCGVQLSGGGGGEEGGRKNKKRGLDEESGESSGESDEDDEDEGGKRGRPRLRLMLSDEAGPCRSGGDSCEELEGGGLRHKVPSSSTSSSSTFVATDQTWDAFLASLDDKTQQHQQQQPPQQQGQGEVGMFDSSVIAADSDIVITHGQLLLDLDDLSNQHGERDSAPSPTLITTTTTRRLGRTLSPTSTSLVEGSSGMYVFDHRDEDEDESSSRWYDDDDDGGRRGGLVVVGSSSGGASGTCPSDALVMEGFNFSSGPSSPVVVGPDGTSTLSYALG